MTSVLSRQSSCKSQIQTERSYLAPQGDCSGPDYSKPCHTGPRVSAIVQGFSLYSVPPQNPTSFDYPNPNSSFVTSLSVSPLSNLSMAVIACMVTERLWFRLQSPLPSEYPGSYWDLLDSNDWSPDDATDGSCYGNFVPPH
jgi:hypothetical protein